MRDIDRFAFDERTAFEARQEALANYTLRPQPVTVTLPFDAEGAVQRTAKYDQWQLLRVMAPTICGYRFPVDEAAREWAAALQEHTGLPEEHNHSLRMWGQLKGGQLPANPDEQEIVNLHGYANELTKFGSTVAEQTQETDLGLLSDELRSLAESDSDEPVFISRRQSDSFANKGIYAPSGDQPKDVLLRAHLELQRRKRGVGRIAVTPEIEYAVTGVYETFTELLDYYNSNGLLIPKRDSNYFNSLVWGIGTEPTADEKHYKDRVNETHERDAQYTLQSFEGKAGSERRDIVAYFACIFGKRKQAIRIAKLLFGNEHDHLIRRIDGKTA